MKLIRKKLDWKLNKDWQGYKIKVKFLQTFFSKLKKIILSLNKKKLGMLKNKAVRITGKEEKCNNGKTCLIYFEFYIYKCDLNIKRVYYIQF